MYHLVQILPDVPEPPAYWLNSDPRAEAAHLGIISQMVLDFQPLSLVNKGFLIDKRLTMPNLQIHTTWWWYQDKIEKVSIWPCQLNPHNFVIFTSVLTIRGLR